MKECIIKFIEDVKDSDYQVVQFHGDLDSNTLPLISYKIKEILYKVTAPNLIFDFSDCTFINSNGIGFLMEIHMKLSRQHRVLVIAGAKAHIKDIFDLVGIPKIMSVFDTIGDAIHNIKKK